MFRTIPLSQLVPVFTCWSCSLIAFLSPVVGNDVSETGLPFIQNYSPDDYGFHPQNWSMVQDGDGVLWVANTQGLMEYDGLEWRTHDLLSSSTIVELERSKEGIIYVGGRGDFGYLSRTDEGELEFTSLLSHLEEDHHKLANVVWDIECLGDKVYFRSTRGIFIWDGVNMEVITGSFSMLKETRGRIFVLEKAVGLKELTADGELSMLPGGEMFESENVYFALEFGDNEEVLFGSQRQGLWILNEKGIRTWETEADEILKNNRLYYAIRLSGDLDGYALATIEDGVVVIDASGQLLQHLNGINGLLDNKVHRLIRDHEGAIWVAQNNGLSRIEFPSALTLFDERSGLEGTYHAIERHDGKLFVASNQGLFHSKPNAGSSMRFEPYPGLYQDTIAGNSAQIWSLLSHEDGLFVGAAERVYRVGKTSEELESFEIGAPSYCMYADERWPDLIFCGLRVGLGVLERGGDGQWAFVGIVEGSDGVILSIEASENGFLWLGTAVSGAYRISLDLSEGNILKPTEIVNYGEAQGVPKGWVNLGKIGDRLLMTAKAGLFAYDKSSDRWTLDPWVQELGLRVNEQISNLTEAPDGSVWLMTSSEHAGIFKAAKAGDTWSINRSPFQRLFKVSSVMDIMPEANGVTWFVGRDQKVYRFDPSHDSSLVAPFHVLIQNVILSQSGGRIALNDETNARAPVVEANDNSMRFEYAATSFTEPAKTEFQVYLEGYDKNWSKWSNESRKDYTGLPGGKYTFRVRARNLYGVEGEEAFFAFQVKTPWFFQTWAWVFYAVLVILIVVLLVKWRVRQLEAKARQLENIIRDRTAEIAEQAEALKEMDKVKNRFFANLSHEFRTPLTLILGPVESELQTTEKEKVSTINNLRLAKDNALRLQRLIDQLLDLSRLESTEFKLKPFRANIEKEIASNVSLFASAAEQRGLQLTYENTSSAKLCSDCWYDADVVQKIVCNLVSNAIKFTAAGGNVRVEFECLNTDKVRIVVSDTGKGISTSDQARIFDRFYQSESGENDFQQGTGIGLALCRELSELHGGGIFLESELNQGSRFTVELGVGAAVFEGLERTLSDREGSSNESKKPSDSSLSTGSATDSDTVSSQSSAVVLSDPTEDSSIILIVEDHVEVRQFIRSQLQGNYQILEASNGMEGLLIAQDVIPDLVISDVMMPEMDGTEFCRALKADDKIDHIPVILLTARAGQSAKIEGLETGADSYLTKPFSALELNARVKNLLLQRKQLREKFRMEGLLTLREEKLPSVEEAFLIELIKLIETHLSDESFGVEAIAETLGMSSRQLLRKVQSITGQTAAVFVRKIRLQHAKQMIEGKALESVSEVAYAVGFNHLSYFAKAFREEYGMTPSELWHAEKNN